MIRELYDRLTGEREGFLQDARDYSTLTIPTLVPPDGSGKTHNVLYKPFQSIGAFGTNSLANKLTGALYPPTEPFFRFEVNTNDEEIQQMEPDALAAIDSKLAALEMKVLKEFTKRGDRAAITEAVKHLVVAGNAVLDIGDKVTQVYPLDRFVVMRDGEGNLLRVIVMTTLDYETFKEQYPDLTSVHNAHRGNRSYDPKTIDVFRSMSRQDGMWKVEEEAAGERISKSEATYPLDKPPFLALRFNRINGQSYGRGYVENLAGDLRSLERLSEAMVEGSAINARVVFLVNPNGFTSARLFEEAPNGGVIPGNANEVTTAKVDKGADLAVASNEIARLEQRLSQAFLLSGSQQRQAERVTAEEVKAVVAEVENTLGGVFAVLSEEFQRPFVARLLSILKRNKTIPDFPEGLLDVAIITGASAIGRGIDKERMLQFIQALAQALGGEAVQSYINVPTAVSQLAASFGINPDGLIKTPQEIAAEQEQAQQMQMVSELGPEAVKAVGTSMNQQPVQGEPTNDS